MNSDIRMRSSNATGGAAVPGVDGGATHRKNRDLLFGGAGRTATAQAVNASSARDMEAVEAENQSQVEGLMGKAGMMKELAIQIDSEVDSQNRMLDGMDNQFSNAGDLLSGTVRRLNEMANSSTGCRQLMLLTGFIVFMLILVYFLFHK
eukprot:Plantae.Rhodophyta-Rhodochaete_pulchella.ctg3355.p1 GENE.Plantae.Rhodophyta-Rhodochaete_pulchella.ctg3355~~Plantae.Rhodophyta-Rhodochaete_pulchella.ctg3355.p1  ORF type:complete len:149 (+),score=19.40 Plantae.Rhodophyta-Rhodochaete_pulchella.ctg3355:147-593(+)